MKRGVMVVCCHIKERQGVIFTQETNGKLVFLLQRKTTLLAFI